jgi:putative DNA primase/helicase
MEQHGYKPHQHTAVWPGEFELLEAGLFEIDADGNPKSQVTGPFEVLGEARDLNSNGWGIALSWKDRDGNQHTEMIAKRDLIGSSTDALRTLADGGLELFAAKISKLRDALLRVTCTERVRLIERGGWVDGVFVLPHKIIGQSEQRFYFVGKRTGVRFAESGTLEDWSNSVAAMASGNPRILFALALGFSGPLFDLLNTMAAGFHIKGTSSCGKTTALIASGSIWGGGGNQGFSSTWRATANGLEGAAASHSSTLLVLDELGEIDAREAAAAVYLLFNGSGKMRAGKTGEARARAEWRVPILSSGEVGLSDKVAEDRGKTARVGLDVRLIDLNADANAGYGIFNTLHGRQGGSQLSDDMKRAALKYYGTAGPAFVAALAKDHGESTKYVIERVKEVTEALTETNTGAQEMRVAQRFAVVGVAGEMARDALNLPWKEGEVIAAVTQLYGEWLSARGGQGPAEVLRAIKAIKDTVDRHGTSRFEDRRNVSGGPIYPIRDRLGWRKFVKEEECWCFNTPGWQEAMSGISDARSLARQLVAKGLLLGGKDDEPTIVEKIDGHTHRVYAVPVAALERLVDDIH